MLSWEYPPVIEGGLGRHVRKLAEQLVADGLEVHVLTRSTGDATHDYVHGVNVHRIAAPATPTDIDEFIAWVDELNRGLAALAAELADLHGFALVHSHDWLVADAARRLSEELELPWLVTVHATEYGRHQGWVANHPQSLIHAAEKRMVHLADHVITCSQYMADHVCEVFGVAVEKLTAIPNGIDPLEIAAPSNVDLALARERYAQPDELLVLMVGRLVYEKGFHLALEALAAVIGRSPGVRYAVAGTGSAEADLHHQADAMRISGHGLFLGWVGDDSLHTLYRIADVCVVPSIYEPFGIVALEAMAGGCPCVVSDTGGLREIVPSDGAVGRRFRSGDAAALGDVLSAVLADRATRENLAVGARARAAQFDWVEVTRRTETVYHSLMRQPVSDR